jgi:hypothetical protein
MIEYKFGLDKSSKKFVCPLCEKRRFVKYLEISTNNYLSDDCGRCDRESACGYHKKPIGADTIITFNKTEIPKSKPDYINSDLVPKSLKKYDENNLIKFLYNHFPKEQVEKCISNYKIGTSKLWNGATIFWQIDEIKNVHTGKIMLFNEITGKRVKEPTAYISWVHKKINKQDYQLQQCLFGLHLLNAKNAIFMHNLNAKHAKMSCKTYGITESEKTAIIMSMFIPNVIWMSTGSKQNFKLALMQPLKNENIIVYPDKGEFTDWNNKTLQLQKLGFKIKCSSIVEDSSYENGTDLADIYFTLEKTKTEKIILSDAEKTVQEIAKTNPAIFDLIKAFDLIDDKGNGIRLF